MAIPSGTVTFLFTDIEGSTRLAQLHRELWESLRARHHTILQSEIEAFHGYVFQIIGDAFCVAFDTASDAIHAAVKIQIDLFTENWGNTPIHVRMGIHTGPAQLQEDGQYLGYLTMSRVQRVMSAAHGGQVLITSTTQELVQDDLPQNVSLRDMGEHRLKDLVRSDHLFQLAIPHLPVDFPPIKSLAGYHHNLPTQLTDFIGREKEMAEIKQILADHRLVTLTGAGGTGKTRLSLQVAADLVELFPDGAWFVELAPLADPVLLPQTILSAFGTGDQPGLTPLQALLDRVRGKKLLLVLDNCEHLIEPVAKLVINLLTESTEIKILTTSREALGTRGEQTWLVPSLSYPDLKNLPAIEQFSQYEAVRLFINQAMLVQPHFELTKENATALAQICFRLDGIPLAIELAASRVKALKVEQIAERLNDRFRLLAGGSRTSIPRQQTLKAMVDWSYDFLFENERTLLRRLSVFSGGCTLEAAEEVCSGDQFQAGDILDLITHLVDKSLVIFDDLTSQTRYHQLETIRLYSRDKLLEAGEGEALRQRHLKFFLKFVEDAEALLTGPQQATMLDSLEVEHGNLRAALEWSLETDPEAGMRLASALWRFWLVRGYLSEGLEWFDKLFLADGSEKPEYRISRAKALYVASHLSQTKGDFSRGLTLAEESLTLAYKTDDQQLLAFALVVRGQASFRVDDLSRAQTLYNASMDLFRKMGDENGVEFVLDCMGALTLRVDDMQQARVLYQECLRIQKKVGDKWKILGTLNSLGQIARVQGELTSAIEMHELGLELANELGSKTGIAYALNGLGWALRDNGNLERAAALYEKSLAIARELGQQSRIVSVLNGLGIIAWRQGDFERARTILEESLDYRRKMGIKLWIAYGQLNLGDVLRSQGDLVQAATLYREALLGYSQLNCTIWDSVECLRRIAGVTGAQKQAARAATLFGAVEALGETVSIVLPPLDRADFDRDIAAVRTQLGSEQFSEAWHAGRSMTLEEAITFGLDELHP